jgi:NADH:ubiquinone oxidoreductase subunit H
MNIKYNLNYIFCFFYKFFLFIIYLLLDLDLIKFLLIFIPILITVAFFTLLERKVLASLQKRRGPNIIGIFGFLQAFADALKLLSKESIIPNLSNFLIFLLAPIMTFFFSILC